MLCFALAAEGETETGIAPVGCDVHRLGVAGGCGWVRCSKHFGGGAGRAVVHADCDGHIDESCGRGGEPLDAGHTRGGITGKRASEGCFILGNKSSGGAAFAL